MSRSSLLLAEHPDDETRRVLSRGKGNLSANPPAVEFSIEAHVFTANGHEFSVLRAAAFSTSDINVEELIEASNGKAEQHSKVSEAAQIIEALIPKDQEWHLAAVVYEAAAADDIDKRTVQRAKSRLKLEQRRASTFQAPSEWRWPVLATPHTTPDFSVASVASVASGDSLSLTHTTHTTQKTLRTRVVSAS